ncbi:hypothetical protein Cgig2_027508 [Carnegiea gigantea]|uniref:Uncharacterized protein n=1 Tax=Carnegiea gigantea TaxID=171969 RepID=A0A9Q1JKE7_9CARY|nr:hypothetical protein Cgig2_027508 [Carnegiea gigantea]
MARGGRRGQPRPVIPSAVQETEQPIDGNISKVSLSSPPQLNETVPAREHSSDGVHPSYATMVDPNEDVIIRQKVVYEWRPLKCTHCRMFGHTREECRKTISQRQEWRAKAPQVASQSQHQQAEAHEPNGEESFQPVTRHTRRLQVISTEGQGSSTPATEKLTANTFSILLEERNKDFLFGKTFGQFPNLWRVLGVLGDFNSVLHQGDRIGGVEVNDGETKDFVECMQHCTLQEFNYEGPFFTWTNKIIWSKIDRALHNELWYEAFAYTHVQLKAQGLSDHTPVILSFPHLPKPKYTFLFCDMWAKDLEFRDIVKARLAQPHRGSQLKKLQQVRRRLKHPLKQLNKSKYADIYAQQAKVRADLTQIQSLLQADPLNVELSQQESQVRDKYISITHSAISLMQQQSKAEWIGLGDECTRMVTARIKQRKSMSCIFHIRDTNGQRVEGFQAVSEVMTRFYQDLLGRREYHRTCGDPVGGGYTTPPRAFRHYRFYKR